MYVCVYFIYSTMDLCSVSMAFQFIGKIINAREKLLLLLLLFRVTPFRSFVIKLNYNNKMLHEKRKSQHKMKT